MDSAGLAFFCADSIHYVFHKKALMLLQNFGWPLYVSVFSLYAG